MALDPEAKAGNIKGSIKQYVSTALAATFVAARIDYGGGVQFSDAGLPEWLQVRVLEPARPATGLGPFDGAGHFARDIYWVVNLNIFVRPAQQATLNNLRLDVLRDAVLAAFSEQTILPVSDYLGTSGALGNLVVFDVLRDAPVVDEERKAELLQHSLAVACRWRESWV